MRVAVGCRVGEAKEVDFLLVGDCSVTSRGNEVGRRRTLDGDSSKTDTESFSDICEVSFNGSLAVDGFVTRIRFFTTNGDNEFMYNNATVQMG